MNWWSSQGSMEPLMGMYDLETHVVWVYLSPIRDFIHQRYIWLYKDSITTVTPTRHKRYMHWLLFWWFGKTGEIKVTEQISSLPPSLPEQVQFCTCAKLIRSVPFHRARYPDDIITVTWQWAGWRLKSPALRLFTQPFIQTQMKDNIKAPRHWPLCGEFIGDRWIPRTNGK